ncbi:MAG: TM2 domain-containing protein [bacterium]|nr:TM2 domain-containing protein [bacterium]
MSDLSPIELATMQQGMTDQQKMQFITQYNGSKKDPTIAIVLAVVLGGLGVDRFYAGDIGLGLLKLFTAGLCGIMWLIDIFLISGRVSEFNRAKAQEIVQAIKITA